MSTYRMMNSLYVYFGLFSKSVMLNNSLELIERTELN